MLKGLREGHVRLSWCESPEIATISRQPQIMSCCQRLVTVFHPKSVKVVYVNQSAFISLQRLTRKITIMISRINKCPIV